MTLLIFLRNTVLTFKKITFVGLYTQFLTIFRNNNISFPVPLMSLMTRTPRMLLPYLIVRESHIQTCHHTLLAAGWRRRPCYPQARPQIPGVDDCAVASTIVRTSGPTTEYVDYPCF